MNKKGFTLIELLAVITILSLIALVTSISVANMVKESKEELSDAQMKAIKAAAESWGADNIADLPTGDYCAYLLLNDLKEDGLLDSNVLNPKNKELISNDLIIKINSRVNKRGKSVLSYEINSENISKCTYIGSSMYVNVPETFTPIVYVEDADESYWKVPNINSKWYDYDNGMWANAAILTEEKNPGDKLTESDILMMYVYIPRYEYKISGAYGKNGNSASSPGEIEIQFINNSQKVADDGYRIHPAFTFGTKELSGIWVGKFELSHATKSTESINCTSSDCIEAKELRILPGKPALRNSTVSSFFYGIKTIEKRYNDYIGNIDIHMIKNSEWGAVAYLSQSIYGKYGNSDYVGGNTEIYQNKSNSYLTGYSNGTPSQSTTNTQCTYDNKTNNCGIGASTTGNIYGIYDMSGGASEYVMGAYADGNIPTISSSGFQANHNVFEDEVSGQIIPNYYDIYLTDNPESACNNNICYGHALSETNGWYSDNTTMVTSSSPWFIRGGKYNDESAGVFSYNSANGSGNGNYSTRAVCVEK